MRDYRVLVEKLAGTQVGGCLWEQYTVCAYRRYPLAEVWLCRLNATDLPEAHTLVLTIFHYFTECVSQFFFYVGGGGGSLLVPLHASLKYNCATSLYWNPGCQRCGFMRSTTCELITGFGGLLQQTPSPPPPLQYPLGSLCLTIFCTLFPTKEPRPRLRKSQHKKTTTSKAYSYLL